MHSRRYDWIADPVVLLQLDSLEEALMSAAGFQAAGGEFHGQLLSDRSKRLRPALLFLSARFGRVRDRGLLVRAATAIEQVHEATLYHDDIVDRARLRRRAPTVAAAHGPRVAAFAGTELLLHGAYNGATLPQPVRREMGAVGRTLCRGQMREIASMGDPRQSILRRVSMMHDKTASLFRLAAGVGALMASVREDQRRLLDRFSLRLGLCFQLANDLADFLPVSQRCDGSSASDLAEGVYTLPVLFALKSCGPSRRRWLLEALASVCDSGAPDVIAEVVDMIASLGGIGRAGDVLGQWSCDARVVAGKLSGQGCGDALSSLLRLIDRVEQMGRGREPAASSEHAPRNARYRLAS